MSVHNLMGENEEKKKTSVFEGVFWHLVPQLDTGGLRSICLPATGSAFLCQGNPLRIKNVLFEMIYEVS